MREFVRVDDALPDSVLKELHRETLSSSYLGNSPLVGSFKASRGFSVTFTEDGLERLRERFSFLVPFVDGALTSTSYRPLWTLKERAIQRIAGLRPNGFFLNLLVIPPGAGIGAHVDATLQSRAQAEVFPMVVSVLYLQCPPQPKGGLLRLWRGDRLVAEITPRPGTLLHFRGDLTHEVTPVPLDAAAPRASLVCEQYCFSEPVLARIPRFSVRSQGRFQALLEAQKNKPLPPLQLD